MYTNIEQALNNDLPVVVLFSESAPTDAGWEKLQGHSCAGFSCESLDGWAYLLPIRPELPPVIRAIADEDFCSGCANRSMDYFGRKGEYIEQQQAYKDFLSKHGISVNDSNLASLKQAAYPLDATMENLRVISGNAELPTITSGMKLLVLGHNCD